MPSCIRQCGQFELIYNELENLNPEIFEYMYSGLSQPYIVSSEKFSTSELQFLNQELNEKK